MKPKNTSTPATQEKTPENKFKTPEDQIIPSGGVVPPSAPLTAVKREGVRLVKGRVVDVGSPPEKKGSKEEGKMTRHEYEHVSGQEEDVQEKQVEKKNDEKKKGEYKPEGVDDYGRPWVVGNEKPVDPETAAEGEGREYLGYEIKGEFTSKDDRGP